jgi:adenosylcobinamide-phosphate synthase
MVAAATPCQGKATNAKQATSRRSQAERWVRFTPAVYQANLSSQAMSFFAVLLALIVEQIKPLPRDNAVHHALLQWMAWTGRNFDAGRPHHAWVVWLVTVAVPTLAIAATFWLVDRYNVLLGLAFDVLVLYLTLGFRQFSHHFTHIRDALERGDEALARKHLAQWRTMSTVDMERSDLLRNVLEHSLLASHRHVFAVFFWFVVLSAFGLGPAGAVLYRMAEFGSRYWAYKQRTIEGGPHERLAELALWAFGMIDAVPARLTAFGFAIVGNFEEAINGWRRDAGLWINPNDGVLLASAAGALGVQLGHGGTQAQAHRQAAEAAGQGVLFEAPLASRGATPGMQARTGHLQSLVGLVWRSVVLWLLLLALLTVANVLG